MRVLMISKACIVGIYQRKLEHIAQADVELLVVVPPSWRDERGEQVLERVHTTGYRLKVLPIMFNGNFHLFFYRGLRQVVQDFQPDIIHIDEEPYNLASWQALRLAKKVDAKSLFFTWQNLNRRYPPPFNWGERWVLDNVDYALMGTKAASAIWRDKGYTGDYAVIPQFGIDPNIFQPTSTTVERPFTIGYSGRLVREKGVHLLLDALSKVNGDWRLRAIGGGPEKESLQQQANALGIADKITFVGQIPSTKMPDQYHQMDVLIVPSLTRPNWKEQFGRVFIEAMASGVPVIGSDSGAIPSVIGNAGLLVPENDIDALAMAIEQLRQSVQLQGDLAEQGRKRILAEYTHERIAQQTVEVYRLLEATSSA